MCRPDASGASACLPRSRAVADECPLIVPDNRERLVEPFAVPAEPPGKRGPGPDGHGSTDPTERQPAQTAPSSAGTVVARPSSLRAATDFFGSMPVNAES